MKSWLSGFCTRDLQCPDPLSCWRRKQMLAAGIFRLRPQENGQKSVCRAPLDTLCQNTHFVKAPRWFSGQTEAIPKASVSTMQSLLLSFRNDPQYGWDTRTLTTFQVGHYPRGQVTSQLGTPVIKRHLTVVLTCTAPANMLPPMIIFKGKRELKLIPTWFVVTVQGKECTYVELMSTWMKKMVLHYTKRMNALLVI